MIDDAIEGGNFQSTSVITLQRPSIFSSKEPKPKPDLEDKKFDLENEFNPEKLPFILHPLVKAISDTNFDIDTPSEQKIDNDLVKLYEYFSLTRDMEFNSPRTEILQNIADLMSSGTNIASRIIILNKGETANAFVGPDGTIFITQSALNKLDTEDEVAAVIGHELGHLIFETNKHLDTSRNDLEKFGIAFAHEVAADSKSSDLLAKAGYNSLAFASAIKKIQGSKRGTEHMGGLSRASMNIGKHMFIDSLTSHQDEKALSSIFHQDIKKTNLEIIQEASQVKNFLQPAELGQMIEKLHPEDLGTVYKLFWGERSSGQYSFIKALNNLVMSRIVKAGLDQEEAVLMLYANPLAFLNYGPPEDCYFINTPEKLNNLVAHLQSFEDKREIRQAIFKQIFNLDTSSDLPSATLNILHLISRHLYDGNLKPEGKGIPVTGSSLISLLENLNKIKFKGVFGDGQRKEENTAILLSYISKIYLNPSSIQITSDEINELKQFLILLKESNISFNKDAIALKYYVKPKDKISLDPNGQKQAICAEICRLLEVKIDEAAFDFMDIDKFFEEYGKNSDDTRAKNLAILIKTIERYCQDNGLTDQDKIKYLNHFNEQIENISFKHDSPILRQLDFITLPEKFKQKYDSSGWGIETLETPPLKNVIMKFNFKTVLAMGLFKSDSDEFYSYLGSALTEFEQSLIKAGIFPNELSKIQLINLCKNLFHGPGNVDRLFLFGRNGESEVETGDIYWRGVEKASIENYDRFFKLPLIKQISEKEDFFNATNISDLLEQTNKYLKNLQFWELEHKSGFNLLEDSALSLIIGRSIAQNFEVILDQGIADADLNYLYRFIDLYYPGGVEKDTLLQNINKRYLSSKEVNFEEKLTYLYQHIEAVGYEGTAIVVDQIEDLSTYRVFRSRLGVEKLKSYLEPNSTIAKVAIADNLSAEIVKKFQDLLKTCEDNSFLVKDVSTEYSRKWMEIFLSRYSSGGARYDQESGKFILSTNGRKVFRSVSDVFTKLQSMSQAQRFAIAHKALFEQNGAFASPENRQILARSLVSSLKVRQRFVRDILSTGVLEADAEYIGFPAANMIGSLLFRAFDINSVNLEKVKDLNPKVGEMMTDQQILKILRSSTRDITLFGAWSRKDPNLLIAKIAEESDQLYYSISAKLNGLLKEEISSTGESSEKNYGIDSGTEAVIRGVESTGALGIRALQLATQFHNFSGAMERRLSETFDANPGMNRLTFWENLHQRAEENPEVEQFMQKIKLGRYLGGGSLQTTYAATFVSDTGETKEIIIKRKNPNVEGLLKKAYTVSRTVLDTVSQKKGAKESANNAKTGLMLIDLAQKWCIDDLNDRYYEEHDNLFRQTVDKFNQEYGKEQFYVPKRVFTELKVKSEELAPGRTVNQVLKDDTVPDNVKKEIVGKMGQFFLYQLRGNSFVDENGKRFFLVHSDPHIGNYMADTSPDGKSGIGVIDRSLYLKLDEKDVKVLEKLIGNSNSTDFVYSFINLVLDRNKDRGITRQTVTAKVFVEVAKEYTRQYAQGKMDKFALLRTLLSELSKQGREAPLELRLMIRNIAALQELMKKYGLVLQ